MRSLIPYTGGGPNDPARCVAHPTPQALGLKHLIQRSFPWARDIGMLACSMHGPTVHNVGRALDVMMPRGESAGSKGTELANWLVEHALDLGIQLVIWNHSQWQPSFRGQVLQPASRLIHYVPHNYATHAEQTDPTNTHEDHVHVEVTETAAPLLVSEPQAFAADDPAFLNFSSERTATREFDDGSDVGPDGRRYDMVFTPAESEAHAAAQRAAQPAQSPSGVAESILVLVLLSAAKRR